MLEYIQKINKGNFTDTMTMDVIKKYCTSYIMIMFFRWNN